VDGNPSEISLSDQLRASAFNDISITHKGLAKSDPIEFIKLCHKKFCEKKIEAFPRMCEIARVQNMLKWQELNAIGNKGKYTDSFGWSPNGEFRFQFEIPEDLYHFMENLVFAGFWEKPNKKIADKFMNRLCKGADPKQLLCWVRSQYGSEQGRVTSYGM
jgi:hypothetical protein